jgi:hypothetical protein
VFATQKFTFAAPLLVSKTKVWRCQICPICPLWTNVEWIQTTEEKPRWVRKITYEVTYSKDLPEYDWVQQPEGDPHWAPRVKLIED